MVHKTVTISDQEEEDDEGTRGWNAMTSALCVPLLSGDQSAGAIYVDSMPVEVTASFSPRARSTSRPSSVPSLRYQASAEAKCP